MSANWPWSELGLDQSAETEREIRRAYAVRLRTIDLETDIEGFEALRAAYQVALSQVAFFAARAEDVQPVAEADINFIAAADEDSCPAPTAELEDFPTSHPDASAEDNGTIAAIIVHLNDKTYVFETWQTLLSAEDVSTPEASLLVERMIVASLDAKPHYAPYPPDRWLRLVDARYGWSTDGVGFLRRHPMSAGLLGDLVDHLGMPVKTPVPAGGRTVHLLLRWYAIVIYTLLFLALHSFVFV